MRDAPVPLIVPIAPVTQFVIAAFYRFTPLHDVVAHQAHLRTVLEAASICGTVLLAPEGVNGTIAGSAGNMEAALEAIRALPGCEAIDVKFSRAADQPFGKLKVKAKREIVTFGQPAADPNAQVGEYVAPADWNALVRDENTVLIDTRNDFEVALGTFEGAIDPRTVRFSDFPDWFRKFHAEQPARRYALFCTGGIRCEKATSFLLSEGVDNVVHLKGGILKYLETVPEEDSLWNGECFVFDQRIAVGHGLEPSATRQDDDERRERPPSRLPEEE